MKKLLFLCRIAYVCTYLGRLNYAACLVEIVFEEELEIQLLNRYLQDRARHPSPYDGKTDAVLLQEAYRLRNRDIGYHRKPDADPGNV